MQKRGGRRIDRGWRRFNGFCFGFPGEGWYHCSKLRFEPFHVLPHRMNTPVASLIETCRGCGAVVPGMDLSGQRYIGASSGCWAVYGTVLAREYGEWRYPAIHRLTVDTYSVQHPGTPSRQSIQSVAAHLIGLLVVLELGWPAARATQAIRSAVERSERFIWLEPPRTRGDLTIADVAKAASLAEHEQVVQRWAHSVWESWRFHHATIRHWANAT
jgi:hypothetical protein